MLSTFCIIPQDYKICHPYRTFSVVTGPKGPRVCLGRTYEVVGIVGRRRESDTFESEQKPGGLVTLIPQPVGRLMGHERCI